MTDCRTCRYNTYINLPGGDWVSCSHPTVIAKTPKFTDGDPAWVNFMTADMRTKDALLMFSSHGKCEAYQS